LSTTFVASTGGHLSELFELSRRMPELERPFHWVTFPTPQSRALLDGSSVSWAAYTGQRDYVGVIRNVPLARKLLDRSHVTAVISTGAAVALSFLPLASRRGIEAHYIEGIARTDGPSVTGRVLARVPGLKLYTQWPQWADARWRYRGSVFEKFVADEMASDAVELRRVVVMLGTMPYSFRRLVDRLIALQVMEAGKCPVLVPRESAYREHIDDHQLQIAELLPKLGLAIGARVEDLTVDHLLMAARQRVISVGDPPTFRLD
jgi:UDP-N-acetylglucosamine--N-acetylmuramyl-(pentapeptide) pyrophosphoryl-undecaprenol N-acetylglucosamine transferase